MAEAVAGADKIMDATKVRMNTPQVLSNLIVVALLSFAITISVIEYDHNEATFLRTTKLLQEPNPCAHATPDIYYMYQALGLAPTNMFHEKKRTQWIHEVEYALCHASLGDASIGSTSPEYDYAKRMTTLAFLLNNHELKPPSNFDAFRTAYNSENSGANKQTEDHVWAAVGESKLKEHLCNITFDDDDVLDGIGEFQRKLYGDLVERISRAYLNALPAFYRLQTSSVHPIPLVTTATQQYERTCMEEHHPFRSDMTAETCPHLNTVRRELRAAGTTAQAMLMVGYHTDKAMATTGLPTGVTSDNPEIDVGNYYKESMPRIDQMLYRLFALTVVSHHDRQTNGNQCFGNLRQGATTKGMMCQEVFEAAGKSADLNADTFEADVAIVDWNDAAHTTNQVKEVVDPWPTTADRLATASGGAGATDGLPALTGLKNYYDGSTQTATYRAVDFDNYQDRMATMIPWQVRRNGAVEDTANSQKWRTGHFKYETDFATGTFAPDTNVYGGDARPQARTCHMDLDHSATFAPPPPAPSWIHDVLAAPSPPAGATLIEGAEKDIKDAVVLACTQNLGWGLYDQARLFGLPDTVREFVLHPRDPSQHGIRDAIGIFDTFEESYFTNVIAGDVLQDDPAFQLRVYSGFQLAVSGLWMTFLGSVFGYLFARAGVPAFLTLYSRVPFIGIRKNNNQEITLFRPKFLKDGVLFLVLLVGTLAAAWAILFVPQESGHYPINDDCKAFFDKDKGANGGVYVTSLQYHYSAVSAKNAPGYVLLVTLLWIIAYEAVFDPIVINQSPALKAIMDANGWEYPPYNVANTLAAIAIAGTATGFAVASAIFQGHNWVALANLENSVEQQKQALWLSIEIRSAIITAICFGVAAGVVSCRWAVEDLKRVPIMVFWIVAIVISLLPALARVTLMTDAGLWEAELSEDGHAVQASFFYISLFASGGYVFVAFAQCINMCTAKVAAGYISYREKRAASLAEMSDVTEANKEAQQLVQERRQLKRQNALDRSQKAALERLQRQKQRLELEKSRKVILNDDGGVLEGQDGFAQESALADPRGAYLPMIRITV